MPPKSLYFNEAAENLPIEVKFSDGTLGTAFPTKYREVYEKFQVTATNKKPEPWADSHRDLHGFE